MKKQSFVENKSCRKKFVEKKKFCKKKSCKEKKFCRKSCRQKEVLKKKLWKLVRFDLTCITYRYWKGMTEFFVLICQRISVTIRYDAIFYANRFCAMQVNLLVNEEVNRICVLVFDYVTVSVILSLRYDCCVRSRLELLNVDIICLWLRFQELI